MQPKVYYPANPERIHLLLKLDPVWWFDDIFRPSNATFWPWLWRQKLPQNFCAFVIGVQDRPHSYQGSKTSHDIFSDGWQVALTNGFLPLISFRGKHVEAYIGWRPIGAFGFALRKAHSKGWVNP